MNNSMTSKSDCHNSKVYKYQSISFQIIIVYPAIYMGTSY